MSLDDSPRSRRSSRRRRSWAFKAIAIVDALMGLRSATGVPSGEQEIVSMEWNM
ncbi:MAG TPA: hypothetical protein VKE40_28285 [Gemmataceae bacterium]|nr:hypothetical protein [Gemmataceae bacterium]